MIRGMRVMLPCVAVCVCSSVYVCVCLRACVERFITSISVYPRLPAVHVHVTTLHAFIHGFA